MSEWPATASLPLAGEPPDEVAATYIGEGRSGVVLGGVDAAGRRLARKVFRSSGLTEAVQVLLLGAPNPYIWNADAIACALLRRRVLAPLVDYWLGGKVRVAEGYASSWNHTHAAYEFQTEFIEGRHAALRHPLNFRHNRELEHLQQEVLAPLQQRLLEAGFDGLLWQAGYANPVATNNFMQESDDPEKLSWAWIDLESGVPAVAPFGLRPLFRFYLARAFQLGRPLFDDVDGERLQSYLAARRGVLESHLGRERLAELERDAASLKEHQERWKAQPRLERSIAYRRSKGEIDEEQAAYYRQHALRWYGREARCAGRRLVGAGLRRLRRLATWLGGLDPAALTRKLLRFLGSQEYRKRFAYELVETRIRAWGRRRQLDEAQQEALCAQLHDEESSVYITDFGIHLAIKPFVKGVQWTLLPTLFAVGAIDAAALALLWAWGGAIGRTGYSAGRLVQSTLEGREKPWVALLTGAMPVIGNVAYPLQLLSSSTDDRAQVAQFIVYDSFTMVGQGVPIWGGADTATEHRCNRLPERLLHFRARRRA